jgi:peptidoglycan/xylan/chitin deacetylase (PgdA/CDA1 family)
MHGNSDLKSILIRLLALTTYYTGMIRLIRFLGRRYTRILLYHSVGDGSSIVARLPEMWTSTSIFAKHMRYLSKHYNVMSLQGLVEALSGETIPERAVAVTFDDGLEDVLEYALPVLRKHQIPATLFLVTELVGSSKPFWIEQIYHLTVKHGTQRVADALRAVTQRCQLPNLTTESDAKQIEEFLAYGLTRRERDDVIGRLYEAIEVDGFRLADEGCRFLDWRQAQAMLHHRVQFGSHGTTHTPFSSMSLEEQVGELTDSRQALELHISDGFRPFAYPFGQSRDISLLSRRLVEEAGFSCALTAMPYLNDSSTSPFELGRIPVGNPPISLFALHIEKPTLKKLVSGISALIPQRLRQPRVQIPAPIRGGSTALASAARAGRYKDSQSGEN